MANSMVDWADAFKNTIDRELSRRIPKNTYPPNLYAPIWYHLNSGGKRLRSTCAIMVYKSIRRDIKKVIPFAAACEILHNWLLIHDDIEDRDTYRRGRFTVWFKYGVNTAINIGDFLSEKVYESIIGLREKNVSDRIILDLIELTADSILRTIKGQALDLYFKRVIPKESEYVSMAGLKTGAYLALPMIGAAMIARADDKTIKLIRRYGEFIGPAYQIVDDALDYDPSCKDSYSDIKEGKRTLIIINCLSRCSPNEKSRLLRIIDKEREFVSAKDVDFVKNLVKKHGSMQYSIDKAKLLANRGKSIIGKIENEKMRRCLGEIADFINDRGILMQKLWVA